MKPVEVCVCLLLLVVQSTRSSPAPEKHLEVRPGGYRLDLNPYPGEGLFTGRVRIDIILSGSSEDQGPSQIKLNADPGLNVNERDVKITRLADLDSSSEEDDSSKEEATLSVKGIKRDKDDLTVLLSQKLHRHHMYQLDLPFDGVLDSDPTKPFYENYYLDASTNEKSWFVVLNLKPYKARTVFPCFDDPKHKTWVELSVSRKKENHILTSMMRTDTSNVTIDGATVKDQFGRTPQMSVNSLALLVSDFQQVPPIFLSSDGIRVGIWGRKDFMKALTKAQQFLPSVIVSLEIFLSRPYPLPQLNMVALPNYTSDNYINAWGLQMFKESDLMNGNSYWLSHRLAKAAATQWLLHLATPHNTSAVPMAVASFLASIVAKQNGVPLGLDQMDPEGVSVYDWHVTKYHSLFLELSKPHSYTKEQLKSQMAILKGQLFLHMLEHTLTLPTLKLGIQNFLANKEFKTYTDDDFWTSITEQAHSDRTLANDYSVTSIAQSWLKQERIPLVTATRDYKDNTIAFTQEPFVNSLETRLGMSKVVKKQSAPDEYWWIPIVMVTQRTLNWSNTTPSVWLRPNHDTITHQLVNLREQYVVVNPANIGLFLVNYDADNWKMLTEHIDEMPETVRAQLLHDAMSLALSGRLDMVTMLNVTTFLRREQAPLVWKTFFPLADRLRKIFVGTSALPLYEAYLQALILPPLEAVGEEADVQSPWKSDFRVKTRHLLCSTHFPNCIEHARAYYEIWMNLTNPDDGMPIANIHLCPVFTYGSDEEWEFGVQRLVNFSPNRTVSERSFLLKTLGGCSRDTTRYMKLMNLMFLDEAANETFSEADRYAVLAAMSSEPQGHLAMYEFLKNNFDALKLGLQTNLWEFFIQMAMGQFKCRDGLEKVTALYESKKGQFGGGAEKKAEEAVESVRMRVKWAEETIPAIEKWLKDLAQHPWKPERFRFKDFVPVPRTRKSG
ncbi:hypothetical protein LSTR_LSTR008644 [Laodelphax striatellus]|uniref:Uncharacterized protein n=1 Tax=Laodelphax striatellus TaxID=195883 RepID=A0A482WM57_LAOST|nr:hypothetical protein LSTR_LSTR008644 [Laodelphax striatellus]